MNEVIESRVLTPAEAYAVQINTIKRETARVCLSASVEIGRILVLAKETVPHGEWGEWLEQNVNYSQSTAGNLMKLYREYGEQSQLDFFEVNKMEIFGSLSPSQALALLALPSVEARQEFVETHEMDELSVRDLEKEIERLRGDLAETENGLAYEKDRADGAESELSETKDELSRAKAALQAATHDKSNTSDLQKKLKELEKQKKEEKQKADIRIGALEKALKDAEKKAAEAEQLSIETKVERVEVPADVENDPKYQKLVKEREGLINQLKLASPDGVRFRMEFDRMQESFSSCVGLIAAISQDDPETGMKLRNATVNTLEQMSLALTNMEGG